MPSPEVQRLAHWGGSVPLRVTTREISVGTTTPSSDLTASIFSGQARLLGGGQVGGACRCVVFAWCQDASAWWVSAVCVKRHPFLRLDAIYFELKVRVHAV